MSNDDLIRRGDLLKPDEKSDKILILGGRVGAGKTLAMAEALMKRKIETVPAVDAVEVVRCKDCQLAKPYERNDGETGYYCNFCGHAFKYGATWERLFTPIKEADDFCSYGERKDND